MPRQLPQELVDYIIDQVSLANDIVTLKHATLTCKSWLPRSSQHLFQTPNVTTTNLSDLEALAATLKESDRLARYISCVTFGLHEEAAVSIQLSLSLMGDVLSRLPHLSEVVVSGMHDSADKELALCPRSALLHPITEKPLPRLTLFFAYAPLTNAVLSLFPSVHTLQVTEWPNGQYPASATTEHRVTELIIRQPQNTASLADLAKLINPPTLARLVVDFRDDLPWSAPPVALEELIRALGAQLTALEIHHCDTGMTDTTCSPYAHARRPRTPLTLMPALQVSPPSRRALTCRPRRSRRRCCCLRTRTTSSSGRRSCSCSRTSHPRSRA